MATHAGGLFQDQNLDVHTNGALIGEKTNGTSPKKKGGLGRRKALNDISNSGKLPVLQPKKHTSMNVVSDEEDFSVSISKFSFRGKTNAYKDSQKVRASGRKALGDLTNLGKLPHAQQARKGSWSKLSSVAEEQAHVNAIVEEQFLHNHQECIEAQKKAIDMDFFLKTIGLSKDVSLQLPSTTVPPLKVKFDSPQKSLEMEEMVEFLEEVKSPPQCAILERHREREFILTTAYGGSPRSPNSCLLLEDYKFPHFVLTQTP